MRFFHISDLHIGRQLHFYNLREEQREVLAQIVEAAKKYRPDGILIAGDIYDKSVPSGEACEILDEFLQELSLVEPVIPVFLIGGNHDSALRLKFASSFLERQKIFVSVLPPRMEEEHLRKVTLQDEYGEVDVYLLPFTKPGHVRGLFPEDEIKSYDEAVKMVLAREKIDFTRRNVLVAHQFFVAGEEEPQRSESEMAYLSVGGIDSVSIECVKEFDYVALGHIHGAQSIGQEHIRYSGTPYKYSVSEEHQKKGITLVTLGRKGEKTTIETIPLTGKRDVRSIKGTLSQVLSRATEENRHDYVRIILTDEESIFRPKDQLEEVYENILEVRVENDRVRNHFQEAGEEEEEFDPVNTFREFYQVMNGQPLSQREEEEYLRVLEEE